MANKTTKRGRGEKDMNLLAYETMLQATGQKPKTEVTAKQATGTSLRGLARNDPKPRN